jgi:ATP-binding cassette, subfamily A (ABC1), member 3
LSVQKALDFALINDSKTLNLAIENTTIFLKRFSHPPYNNDQFLVAFIAIFPIIIILSFSFVVILTAKAIVQEKESGLKEAMKLMGMKTWIYWLSWYIKTFVMLLPSLIFIAISYKIELTLPKGEKSAILNQTDPFLFFLFMILQASSLITFIFMCTTFFKKSNSAATGTGIIYFLTYLPFIYVSIRYEFIDFPIKLVLCLINNIAICTGIQLFGMFEATNDGLNFSNWSEGINITDNLSLLHVMLMLLVNHVIHLLLTYYFENIFPGDHGIAKPWYFPINCLRRKHKINSNDKNNIEMIKKKINDNDNIHSQIFIEDESIYSTRNIGIEINNIVKVFKQLGTIKKAVQNLTLNIYEGQISVLLGHNGAGKSTTISMITGLCEPTSGNILINNNDIVENTNEARSVLGYCPQHNLLFDDLTVYEHLKLFSKLKQNYNENEINNMLDLINLTDKKHALSKTLSGGMKRKLSVAIAFIGGSKIVILDEPSNYLFI